MRPLPAPLPRLFKQLRQRGFPLSPADYAAVHQALCSGFGWESLADLRELLCALWAKTRPEQQLLRALFGQYQFELEDWALPANPQTTAETVDATAATATTTGMAAPQTPHAATPPPIAEPTVTPVPESRMGLPPLSRAGVNTPNYHFVFVPEYPLTYREVAQAWRRLRQPLRTGPPVELDVAATLQRRARWGVASGVVLVPRRRNTARLLLLVDQQGSMTPYHGFVAEVCAAILDAGKVLHAACYYFHDTPALGADESLLDTLPGLFPNLDPLLPRLEPLTDGVLYRQPRLLQSVRVAQVLDAEAPGAAVVVISDGGAARGHYDAVRLLDTVAFLKALYAHTQRVVWLNPIAPAHWPASSAGQLARYVPMFPLTRSGLYAAVDALRGRPVHGPIPVEQPL